MMRIVSLALAALALALFAAGPALADKPVEHEGTVVKAADGKLTMTNKGSTDKHTHTVAKDAKISLDGKPAKLEDLKEGYHVKVSVHGDHGAVKIDAHSEKK